MVKTLVALASIAALLYILLVGALYVFQRSMIYIPGKNMAVVAPPAGIEVVHATTADGLKLEGWYRRPQPGMPLIVLFHGNADHHANAIHYMAHHARAGYGVLSTEYRGYAGNPGKPTEQGLYADGRAWINWLLAQGIAPQDIVLYGQSVGTGIAVQMATEFPQAQALILFAPFTSLPDVAQKQYFYIPLKWLMLDQYRSIDKIGSIKMPLLIINGLSDTIIPPEQGVALYNMAKTQKSLVQITGGGHNDIPPDIIALKVEHFLQANEKGRQSGSPP